MQHVWICLRTIYLTQHRCSTYGVWGTVPAGNLRTSDVQVTQHTGVALCVSVPGVRVCVLTCGTYVRTQGGKSEHD